MSGSRGLRTCPESLSVELSWANLPRRSDRGKVRCDFMKRRSFVQSEASHPTQAPVTRSLTLGTEGEGSVFRFCEYGLAGSAFQASMSQLAGLAGNRIFIPGSSGSDAIISRPRRSCFLPAPAPDRKKSQTQDLPLAYRGLRRLRLEGESRRLRSVPQRDKCAVDNRCPENWSTPAR